MTEPGSQSEDGLEHLVHESHRRLYQAVEELSQVSQALEAKVREDRGSLLRRVRELSMLSEISSALQGTMELGRMLRMILVAVTAGQGLGFNRAFLLLLDDETGALDGELGTGPSDAEEAGRIWRELSERNLSLREMLDSYEAWEQRRERGVQQIVARLKFAPDGRPLCLTRGMETGRTIKIRGCCATERSGPPPELIGELLSHGPVTVEGCRACEGSRDIGTLTTSRNFAVVPLMVRGKPIGALVVDNAITHKPIAPEELELLETFANQAAIAVANSRLLARLADHVAQLAEANRLLKMRTQQLLRAERLSAAGAVVADVAHEIRNPLVAIGAYARAVARDMDPDDTQHPKVQVIVEETNRLESVLSEVLSFVRLAVPDREATDLNQVIVQVLDLVELEAESASVAIETQLAPELPLLLLDPNQIRQVLLNLCRNAIQAMAEGGTLRVMTALDGTRVRISVTDNGTGIPEENRPRVFDSFYTTKSSGTGLGLPISREIMRNHGGTLSLRETGPGGTTFDVLLPLDQAGERGDRF